jgi:hypothetical protein
MGKFAPLKLGHPLIGEICLACQKPFVAGDVTTLIALGPGDDPEAREKAKKRLPYSAVAVPVHWDCVDPELQASYGSSVG